MMYAQLQMGCLHSAVTPQDTAALLRCFRCVLLCLSPLLPCCHQHHQHITQSSHSISAIDPAPNLMMYIHMQMGCLHSAVTPQDEAALLRCFRCVLLCLSLILSCSHQHHNHQHITQSSHSISAIGPALTAMLFFQMQMGCLHSAVEPQEKATLLRHFNSGKLRALLLTDAYGLGLDFKDVDIVLGVSCVTVIIIQNQLPCF
jgi:uncharacterized C2H2 Zn-finger protein